MFCEHTACLVYKAECFRDVFLGKAHFMLAERHLTLTERDSESRLGSIGLLPKHWLDESSVWWVPSLLLASGVCVRQHVTSIQRMQEGMLLCVFWHVCVCAWMMCVEEAPYMQLRYISSFLLRQSARGGIGTYPLTYQSPSCEGKKKKKRKNSYVNLVSLHSSPSSLNK